MTDEQNPSFIPHHFGTPRQRPSILPKSYMMPDSPEAADNLEPVLEAILRPSRSNPSLRVVSNRPGSVRSTGSRNGVSRHALLKSEALRYQTVEKDMPVPPVLTETTLLPTSSQDEVKPVALPAIAVPARRSSKTDLLPPSLPPLEPDASQKPPIFCIDPLMHPQEMHGKMHHRGLVSGADFCDAGMAMSRESSIRAPDSLKVSSLSSSNNALLTGTVVRTLTGGDLCEAEVDVSEHVHGDHSSALKVRPALEPPPQDHSHDGHHGISKVRRADDDDGKEASQRRSVDVAHLPTTTESYMAERGHHGHHQQSKVKALIDLPSLLVTQQSYSPNEFHEGHIWIEKVQSNHVGQNRNTFTASNSDSDSMPRLVASPAAEPKIPKVAADSSKATSYWGFIPRFRENKQEESPLTEEAPVSKPLSVVLSAGTSNHNGLGIPKSMVQTVDTKVDKSQSLEDCKRPSSSSRGSQDARSGSLAGPNPDIDQENQQHDFKRDSEHAIINRSMTGNELQGRLLDEENTHHSQRRSTDATLAKSSQAHRRIVSDEGAKSRFFSAKLDPGRTARWLQELLRSQDSYTSKLTKLPEKLHPRHQRHEDYTLNHGTEITTRATTFSEKEAEEVGAMNIAMNNLEQLLNEALQIANEFAERDKDSHVDEDRLRSQLASLLENHPDTPYPESVHESFQSETSFEECERSSDPFLTVSPEQPMVFVGACEGLAHGCEAIPLRSIKRKGLTRPDMRSGNINGPTFPDRGSSLRNRGGLDGLNTRGHVLPILPLDDRNVDHFVRPEASPFHGHSSKDGPTRRDIHEFIRDFHQPPIAPRDSSICIRKATDTPEPLHPNAARGASEMRRRDADVCSLDGGASDDMVEFSTPSQSGRKYTGPSGLNIMSRTKKREAPAANSTGASRGPEHSKRAHDLKNVSLRGKSHVSIRDAQRFSLMKSHKRQPIARDWSPVRKRFVATVACISTALIGVLVGIYAGIVPSVQYYIADFEHYSILGNVGLYLGMALPTFFCWPLPLLHGRKPYILSSLAVAMPLLFPQAVAVSALRSPYTSVWRWALLLPRAIMGIALGFASMNFHSILTDLFGASLMSSKPHQEVVDHYDVRRHGGGLGVWLGIWTWCFIGSLSVGFLVGALVIDTLPPSWGLYISIALIAVVLILNVLTPEVRRSAWRRSVAEVRNGSQVSRRVARGEIMMHRVKDGPKWWGQEMYHGAALSLEMLRQPGFLVMAIYSAWIYAQVVLIIVLLGSLTSRYYRLKPPLVGAAVSSVAIGAFAAVPFQKANLFSRARYNPQISNKMTVDKKVAWTSHLVRRAIFTTILPIAGVLYAIVSFGPPVHLFFPCFFAATVGFLSCLAIAECNGLLMEAWDCSDLQPGMTGRSKSKKNPTKRTNYSSFPRVQAGYAFIHSLGFVFAAGATGVGGMAQRNLGQRAATAVVASILFILTMLLLGVLIRFRQVEIIPRSRSVEMDKWTNERRASVRRRASAIAAAKASGQKDITDVPEEDVGWRPLIVGNPLEKKRRMNILELGSLTRWTEIRKKNHLIDQGAHLNRRAVELARNELEQKGMEIFDDIQRGGAIVGDLVRKVSKRSMPSRTSRENSTDDDATRRAAPKDIAPPGAGLGHKHATTYPLDVFVERECVMGQSVPEEIEDAASIQAFEHKNDGGDKYSPELEQDALQIEDDPRAHSSHMSSKVKPSDPDGTRIREAHGAHMESKVRPAKLD